MVAIAGTRRGEGGSKQMGCAKGGIRGVQGVTFTGQLENEGSNNSLRSGCGQNKTFRFLRVVGETLPISFKLR